MNQFFNRVVAQVLVVCMLSLGVPLQSHAGIVGTDDIASSSQRERVNSFLDRAEVRSALEAQGVDAEAAKARVYAMTEDEVSALAGRIDELPAGGDVIGVLFAIFIILLVTDILGLTKVFPFTRSVR